MVMYINYFILLGVMSLMSRGPSILILLLTGIVMSMVTIFQSNKWYMPTRFLGDESAALPCISRQIEAEIGLVNSNLPSNITLAQEHAEHATEHLDTNTTKELTERNERVSNDLTRGLSDLQASINAKPSPATQVINDKVTNINATLQDAIAVRIEQDQLSNSTVNALAINDILGEVLGIMEQAMELKRRAKKQVLRQIPHR